MVHVFYDVIIVFFNNRFARANVLYPPIASLLHLPITAPKCPHFAKPETCRKICRAKKADRIDLPFFIRNKNLQLGRMSENHCLIRSNSYGYRVLASCCYGIAIEGVTALGHLNLVSARIQV
jgi:hypothetical protein